MAPARRLLRRHAELGCSDICPRPLVRVARGRPQPACLDLPDPAADDDIVGDEGMVLESRYRLHTRLIDIVHHPDPLAECTCAEFEFGQCWVEGDIVRVDSFVPAQ